MSQINNVTQMSGYTTEAYQQMVGVAKQHYISETELAALLLQEGQNGKNFTDAWTAVKPRLSEPKPTSAGTLNQWVGVASPLAGLSALITELSAEQRKENREVMKAQTDSIVMSMEQQADEIRKKAVAQLACGVVSGAINIGMGAAQFGMGVKQLNLGRQQAQVAEQQKTLSTQMNEMSGKTLGNARKMHEAIGTEASAIGAKSQAYGVMGQSMSQLGQGVGGIIGSVGDFVGAQYDAVIKEMDAAQEQMRANRDALKSVTDSLSELIQKAISTQDAIQQNMNQTRARILG